ncbi:hypothetical protein AwEntero_32040 [Enterobacterales bacterium]|nr:hypothetical protein AwEntero_32040 [Enterobacterales bacterium]
MNAAKWRQTGETRYGVILMALSLNGNYLSSFKRFLRWLLSFTQVTYLSKLPGIHSIAALITFE